MQNQDIETVFAYHEATKHHFHQYAPGPGGMDWANQPDPFRCYFGAPHFPLEILRPDSEIEFTQSPAPLNQRSISQLLYDSLAISAWKQAGDSRWALRVNPSSGNLHPTEGYLICEPVAGICDQPAVYHYSSKEHALELRAKLNSVDWVGLVEGFPPQTCFIGLSSIPWREAWKYGERAFRYCHHDIGHALAAIRLAAAGLGWQACLIDNVSSDDLNLVLGFQNQAGLGAEHPDCLVALFPNKSAHAKTTSIKLNINQLRNLEWMGTPNQLGSEIVNWPMIAEVLEATVKSRTQAEGFNPLDRSSSTTACLSDKGYRRQLIHQRRSAVAFDGETSMSQEAFYSILQAVKPGGPPFDLLSWPACVHLIIFVHRVQGLASGLYLLIRNVSVLDDIKSALRPDFDWSKPLGCPSDLSFFLLKEADLREAARLVSCHQNIASDGCFSLGMLAEFEGMIQHHGAWAYPRLFWECGMIGQVLYLEAEEAGLRGTGIGCFFDDAVHQLLGLQTARYQSLYHFTIGSPLEDFRITTLPAYTRT